MYPENKNYMYPENKTGVESFFKASEYELGEVIGFEVAA